MQQKDYVEKQIEAMGRFLARLFAKVSGNDLNPAEASAEASREVEEELGISLESILEIKEHELIAVLSASGKFDAANFEKLADVLAVLGEKQNDIKLYDKALYLYQYLETESKEYSVDRNIKISRVKGLITSIK